MKKIVIKSIKDDDWIKTIDKKRPVAEQEKTILQEALKKHQEETGDNDAVSKLLEMMRVGTAGSGNKEHKGRPGKVGGSAPGNQTEIIKDFTKFTSKEYGTKEIDRITPEDFNKEGTSIWMTEKGTLIKVFDHADVHYIAQMNGVKLFNKDGSPVMDETGQKPEFTKWIANTFLEAGWIRINVSEYGIAFEISETVSSSLLRKIQKLIGFGRDSKIQVPNINIKIALASSSNDNWFECTLEEFLNAEGIIIDGNNIVLRVGTKGSGNKGHKGRPGQVGGSEAGSGIDTDEEKAKLSKMLNNSTYEEVQVVYQKATGRDDVAHFITTTFNYSDPESGLSAETYSVYSSFGDELRIVGAVFDNKNKVMAGEFTRILRKDGVMEHHMFDLKEKYQGKGFGGNFYEWCEQMYIAAGLIGIALQANLSIGGYAWARMGFSWPSDNNRDWAERFIDWMKANSYFDIPEMLTATAWEIASFIDATGNPLGKEFLLGREWSGYKDLSPNSIGIQVGTTYYESKK